MGADFERDLRNAIGSFVEVPKSLQAEIQHLEDLLTVSPQKLKQITDHFVEELAKGM